MGYLPTKEQNLAAVETEKLLDLIRDEDNLVNLSKFSIGDKKDSEYIQKGYLKGREILLPHDPDLIRMIVGLHKSYPKNETSLYIEPYRFYVKGASLTGLTLEKILKIAPPPGKVFQTTFLVYADENGQELAKIEFEVEQKEDHTKLFCELLWPDYPFTRSLHALISPEHIVTHADGAVREYSKEQYNERIGKPYNFNKNIKYAKKFKINGKLPLQELNYISKVFFSFSTRYLKIRSLPEPPWSQASRFIKSLIKK